MRFQTLLVVAALSLLLASVVFYEFSVLSRLEQPTTSGKHGRPALPVIISPNSQQQQQQQRNGVLRDAQQILKDIQQRSRRFAQRTTIPFSWQPIQLDDNNNELDDDAAALFSTTATTTTTPISQARSTLSPSSPPTFTTKRTTASIAARTETTKPKISVPTSHDESKKHEKAHTNTHPKTWPTIPGAPSDYTVHIPDKTERGDDKGGANFRKFSNEQMEARMDAAEASGHIQYEYPIPAVAVPSSGVKIVGLVAVRNVDDNIAAFLRILASICDSLIVLDDASTDNTVAAVLEVARETRVEALVTKSEWLRNEAQDKNILLRTARRLGGTAFIVPDYDETFSAACFEDDYLRKTIAAMPPGSRLGLHWKEYWNGFEYHRVDPMQPNQNFLNRFIPIVFVDRNDMTLYVPEKDKALKIHYPRIPMTYGGVTFADNRDCVIVEFRFVSLINVYIKRIWYAAFGALHGKARQALGRMNALLDAEPTLADADPHWLTPAVRTFAESFQRIETWRARQICQWLAAYGRAPFENIDMWHVDWPALSARLLDPSQPQILTPDDFKGVNFTQSKFMNKLDKHNSNSGKHYHNLADLEANLAALGQ